MKKLLILTIGFVLSFKAFAQHEGMANHNGNSSGNDTFSGIQILLGAILFVLIVAVLMWFFSYKRNENSQK